VKVGEVTAQAASASWAERPQEVSVVVATYNRVAFLAGLVEALEGQTVPVEVVVADDGSSDATWAWLETFAATATLPFLALRLAHTGGPSVPRNTAAAHARGRLLAVTDDDCLPEPEWIAGLVRAMSRGAGIAQGATRPVDTHHGAWDRAVNVERPTALYETCNLAFDRERFLDLGGFPTFNVLRHLPRGFGEDVVLGARAAREGGLAWAGDAVVRHRWIASSYRQHLDGLRRLAGFPWLAREVPEVADRLLLGVFLSHRTAEFDAAVASVLLATVSRHPVLAAGAIPWAASRFRAARAKRPRLAIRLAQLAVADAVGLASLLEGSVRHRRVVL
jgi:glycosyltransferase involved in cell wall biosynthesis